jgi:hypothetical protein
MQSFGFTVSKFQGRAGMTGTGQTRNFEILELVNGGLPLTLMREGQAGDAEAFNLRGEGISAV